MCTVLISSSVWRKLVSSQIGPNTIPTIHLSISHCKHLLYFSFILKLVATRKLLQRIVNFGTIILISSRVKTTMPIPHVVMVLKSWTYKSILAWWFIGVYLAFSPTPSSPAVKLIWIIDFFSSLAYDTLTFITMCITLTYAI